MTQSQTMAWVDHDYSRIMMSSLLCNDVQSEILDMAYSVNVSIVYTVSLVVYTLYGNFYKPDTVKIFNFYLI